MPTRSPSLRHALAGLTACAACHTATAAEWSMEPALSWMLDYDSNRRLAVRGEQADEGGWLTFDAKLRRATETSEIALLPHVQLQRFSGDSALDSNDGSLQLAGTHHSERTSVSGSVQYSRESTLTTELADTGIIDAATRRQAKVVTVSLAHSLSNRQQILANAGYTDVEFPDGLPFGLVGYRYPSLDLAYALGVSARTTFTVTTFGSRSTAPIVHYESRNAGMRLSVDHSFTERVRLSASVGVAQSDVLSNRKTGGVWSFSAIRDEELTRWTLTYDHSNQPSGSGTLVLRDSLTLSAERSIAPKLYATLSFRGDRNHDLNSKFNYDNRRYLSGDGGLEWRMSPEWTCSLTVGASESQLPGPYQTARGWRSGVRVRWAPQPASRSR